jgi:hypothetical protein
MQTCDQFSAQLFKVESGPRAAPLYWRTHHCQTRQQVAIAQLSGMYAKMYLY